ncbi:MAG TPA: ABC transporter permease [Cellvibrio sp.]|nr:ABC transporter permease [Cellvibrio sp.]
MHNTLIQIYNISTMNLCAIPRRLGSSLTAVLGVACVVGVFVSVLSMATGFQRTMASAGSPDTVIFIRAGALTEMSSGLSFEQTQLVAQLPGIARRDNQPLTSAELFVVADLAKKTSNLAANVSLRGVQPAAFTVRDKVKIIAGRNFEPGKNELIVGRSAQQQFANLEIGNKIKLGQSQWQVVGIFAAEGGLPESEIWCDAKILQGIYRRGNRFQTIRAKIDGPDSVAQLRAAIAADPQMIVDVRLETEYLAEQSEPLSKFIKLVGYPLAIIMALGAIFAAINTMYTSVSARTREIATLRALGFGPLPVAASILLESLVLALAGGVIGSIVVYCVFNGYTVSTLNFASFSQVVFDFAVTPSLVIQGVVMAIVIGIIGGLFPAYRAVNMPVAAALRDL